MSKTLSSKRQKMNKQRQSRIFIVIAIICVFAVLPVCRTSTVLADARVFSLSIFNNGNENNASLANLGVIRIWLRLDGANADVLVSSISATDQSGNDAMELLRVAAYDGLVRMIDVSKLLNWQTIDLSIEAYGQTIDVLLINNRYEPTHEPQPTPPPDYTGYTDHTDILYRLDYMIVQLDRLHGLSADNGEAIRFMHMWRIGLAAFSIAVKLMIIFALVWRNH